MSLTLLVPGLLWPAEVLRDATFDLALPGLSALLGRGRIEAAPAYDAWLAAAFAQPQPLPAAALRLLGDGGSPGADYWLCLDPVHLRIREHALYLDDPAALALSEDEDRQLRAELAPLLMPLGELTAVRPGRWYLRLTAPPELETLALADATGQSVDPGLPGGPDGRRWRNLLAHVQTQLHRHPVNNRRDRDGLPAINSLWPWGGGYPGSRTHGDRAINFASILSRDPVVAGLAQANGIRREPLPERCPATTTATLALLDTLCAANAATDALAWREALLRLERDWFAPAMSQFQQGRLPALQLLAWGHRRGCAIALDWRQRWQFWRRPRTLADLP